MKNIPGQPSITTLIVLLFLGSAIGVVTGHQITSNKSELLDAMSPASKGRLASNTEQLNKLIDDLKENESGINGNLINKRQEISKLYLSLADM